MTILDRVFDFLARVGRQPHRETELPHDSIARGDV
jgi:hypothetical protein